MLALPRYWNNLKLKEVKEVKERANEINKIHVAKSQNNL